MRPKKWLTCLFAAVCSAGIFAAAPTAHAQYTGPEQLAAKKAAAKTTTVADVLKNPVDDERVLLKGRITKQTEHDKYEFADSTGTITAEIDDKVFAGRQIGPDTLIEIIGKVDKDTFKPVKIEVKRFTVLDGNTK